MSKFAWLSLVNAKEERIESDLLELPPAQAPFEGFPKYKRSPRIIKRITESKIEINKPPEKKVMSKESILQVVLPPLAMLCITVGISIIMTRGLYVLMAVAGNVMTTIASAAKFVSEKKE